jgi:uncharacterized protein (DUF1778 family)
LEARLTPAADDLITRAASLVGETRSQFVVQAAEERAARLIGRTDLTLIPAEQFDQIILSLDQAEPLPDLAALAARPRPYAR